MLLIQGETMDETKLQELLTGSRRIELLNEASEHLARAIGSEDLPSRTVENNIAIRNLHQVVTELSEIVTMMITDLQLAIQTSYHTRMNNISTEGGLIALMKLLEEKELVSQEEIRKRFESEVLPEIMARMKSDKPE